VFGIRNFKFAASISFALLHLHQLHDGKGCMRFGGRVRTKILTEDIHIHKRHSRRVFFQRLSEPDNVHDQSVLDILRSVNNPGQGQYPNNKQLHASGRLNSTHSEIRKLAISHGASSYLMSSILNSIFSHRLITRCSWCLILNSFQHLDMFEQDRFSHTRSTEQAVAVTHAIFQI